MAGDTHIIKVLHQSPCISGKTNLSTDCQEYCPQLVLLIYKDLHTVLHHSVTGKICKPRVNCLHELVKSFTNLKGNSFTIIILANAPLFS
jgi:hypothetical protein